MHRFRIVVEKTDRNLSAYCPELPGCIATGKTREQAACNMQKAVERHVAGMLEDNASIPKPAMTLEQLLSRITDDNIHHEIDTVPAAGEERWERGEG